MCLRAIAEGTGFQNHQVSCSSQHTQNYAQQSLLPQSKLRLCQPKILRVSKPLNICGLISLLPPLSSSVKSLVPAKFLKDHSYSQSAKMPKMQLHLQSCHLVPVCRGRGASLAAHLISMSIMMVQPGPSPKLNELPLLERGNQI